MFALDHVKACFILILCGLSLAVIMGYNIKGGLYVILGGCGKSEDIKKRREEVCCGFFKRSSNNSSLSLTFINYWGCSCHCFYSWDYSWDPQKSHHVVGVLGKTVIKKCYYKRGFGCLPVVLLFLSYGFLKFEHLFFQCLLFSFGILTFFQGLVLESWPLIRALIETYFHEFFFDISLLELVE